MSNFCPYGSKHIDRTSYGQVSYNPTSTRFLLEVLISRPGSSQAIELDSPGKARHLCFEKSLMTLTYT